MHRGKVAHTILPQIVLEQEADIVIISEQHSQMLNGLWFEDESKTAAIWIPNRRWIQPKNHGKGNGFVWVQLEDITLVSCYLTPSDHIDEFQRKLDAIEDSIRDIGGLFMVAGDLNSRAVEWGTQTTNSRGRRIVQMAARTGLTFANTGGVPTFRRPGCEGTIPDLTLVSEETAHKVKDWKVLEIYTASDHQYISYSLESSRPAPESLNRKYTSTRKWNVNKLNKTALINEIDRLSENTEFEGNAISTVTQIMKIITRGCAKAMPRMKRPKTHKTAVHWWNDEIDELRRNCIRRRRKFTRARRRGAAEAEHSEYKETRKQLQKAIFNSKKDKWNELREDINRNPWGLGYKIVMEKLCNKSPVREMDEKTMEHIVETLFPKHDIRNDDGFEDHPSNAPIFTEEELTLAARKLVNRKAPGPDGIPAEVIKEIAHKRPKLLLKMYNSCLREGVFPKAWKEQTLVLISKGKGDPNSPSSYRPLCMLDTAGKLLERLMKPRIETAINTAGGLSQRQHGFRPGKSTAGALKDVVNAFTSAQEKSPHTRPVVLLATLDVKNAFNSLRWIDVLQALKENFNVPSYLMKMTRSYLNDRVLTYNTSGGPKKMQITSGAAQGSILGPDLWNVSYDGILKMQMPEDSFLVGYADDIAAVVTARNTIEAQRKLRQVMIRAKNWLESHGLQLATHKTELLLLTRRHIPTEIDVRLDDLVIRTTKSINYLGIRLDSKLTFSNQIKYATTKAAQTTAKLSRLMANVGGPLQSKRKLLMEACNSILLYGSEIWAHTLTTKSRAKTLLTVQRTAALRVTSAYRTVSASAVLIIAGMTPIDLQALERNQIWNIKTGNLHEASQQAQMEQIRQETIDNWQTRWRNEKHGRWTSKLIPDVRKWLSRQVGEVNYYITQMLSGHGYFRKYLHKMGKGNTPFCIYEAEDTIDDAEHTFFSCARWSESRRDLESKIGIFDPMSLVEKMIASEENWKAAAEYIEAILRRKKRDLDGLEESTNQ